MTTVYTNEFITEAVANAQPGDVLDAGVYNALREQEMARRKVEPEAVRAFIDTPSFAEGVPVEPMEFNSHIARLVNSYRSANPRVIHAAAVKILDETTDPVTRLTELYYQCQSAFEKMIADIRQQIELPQTDRLFALGWECVAFPRMLPNLGMYKAILLFVEQDPSNALITHVVFIPASGSANVYSSRYSL